MADVLILWAPSKEEVSERLKAELFMNIVGRPRVPTTWNTPAGTTVTVNFGGTVNVHATAVSTSSASDSS